MTLRREEGFRWEDVPLLPYKEGDARFRGVSRQVLFGGEAGASSELRYFEIDPGGWSSLERHRHPHAVVVVRGRGRVLVDSRISEIEPFDAVEVPPGTWHQFRAASDATLGFLCLVDRERDRPETPTPDELEVLRRDPEVAAFVRA